MDDNVDINRAWEIIVEDMNILTKENLGYYELNLQTTCRNAETYRLRSEVQNYLIRFAMRTYCNNT
jgi:hypothetical protein